MRKSRKLISSLWLVSVLASGCDESDEGADAGTTPSGAADGGVCADLNAMVTPTIPTVLLVVDRSASMEKPFAGAANRWDAVHATLMGPGGIVETFQSEVRFGLALYTTERGQCPDLIEVAPALDNGQAIETVYGPAQPGAATPTGEAIMAVTPTLNAVPDPGPKAIILATDGLPDTCGDENTSDAARDLSVSAVGSAFDLGIQTTVISVGPDSAQPHLQALADAGRGVAPGDPSAPYYVALDTAGLVEAFGAAIAATRTCTFDLEGSVSPEAALGGSVFLDGRLLSADEWHLDDPDTIALRGPACETLQAGGEHTVAASFPCVEPVD